MKSPCTPCEPMLLLDFSGGLIAATALDPVAAWHTQRLPADSAHTLSESARDDVFDHWTPHGQVTIDLSQLARLYRRVGAAIAAPAGIP